MWEHLFEAVIAFFLVLFGWSGLGEVTAPPTEEGEQVLSSEVVVAYVIDGDTFDTADGERVRLLGVDTPEREECYYQESTEFVRQWLEGATVRLESDVREVDTYGRLLRYVFIDQEPDGSATSTELLVNDVLLAEGYATYLPIGPDRRYRLQFRDSWEAAQAREVGRWSVCDE